MPTEPFEVEVVFALPEAQVLHRVRCRPGETAADAIAKAGLAGEAARPLARFGRMITLETPMAPGDRVEILRPLFADPKERRRQKAKAAASARRRGA